MIKKLLSTLSNVVSMPSVDDKKADLYRNLIRREAKIGGELFGPMQPGMRREFFCLDEHTIVFHEEWTAPNGQPQLKTIRYDVRPSGVLKMANNGYYQAVDKAEIKKLLQAVRLYKVRTHQELYPFVSV